MGIFSTLTVTCPDDFDVNAAPAVQMRRAFLLRLPFRLRVGTLFSFRPPNESQSRIWLHNAVNLPEGTSLDAVHAAVAVSKQGYDSLITDALVILDGQTFEGSDLDVIRADKVPAGLADGSFDALKLLNAFICAYASAGRVLHGGRLLHPLTHAQFFDYKRVEFTIRTPPDFELPQSDVLDAFTWRPDRGFPVATQYTGTWDDLPQAQLNDIANQFRLTQEHAFYELAFKAKTEMISRDPIVALVLACAALDAR
jgi:hypothetical protein